MSAPESPEADPAALAAEAGAWLARRDRGLTPAEQDAFLQWLREDPRRRAALARLDRTWGALDALAEWQPAHSTRPNPDLLAPGRVHVGRSRRALAGATLAAAVLMVVAVGFVVRSARAPVAELAAPSQGLRVIPRPERHLLPDGSVAEANHGARYVVEISAAERRVRLIEGEMHVTVRKDAARPFVVATDRVAVLAVGTAFNVRRGRGAVDVLVTEGRVQVQTPAAASAGPATTLPVAQGERARVDTAGPAAKTVVTALSADEIARELAWQGVRLEFEALPLAAVVAEFNLRNARQLALGDTAAGQVRVAGTFRADQVEAFARMLEASFGIAVERRAEGPWVLRRAAEQP